MRAYAQAAAAAESVCCGRSTRRDSRSRTPAETASSTAFRDWPRAAARPTKASWRTSWGSCGVCPTPGRYYLADEPSPETTTPGRLGGAHQGAGPWPAARRQWGGICAGGPDANVRLDARPRHRARFGCLPVFGGSPDPNRLFRRPAERLRPRSGGQAAGHQQVVALQSWRWGDSVIDSQAARSIRLDPLSHPRRDRGPAQRGHRERSRGPHPLVPAPQVIGWEPGQRPGNWSNPPDTEQRWANLVSGAFAPPPVPKPSAFEARSAAGTGPGAQSRSIGPAHDPSWLAVPTRPPVRRRCRQIARPGRPHPALRVEAERTAAGGRPRAPARPAHSARRRATAHADGHGRPRRQGRHATKVRRASPGGGLRVKKRRA